jgi:hypothetical protein
MRRTAGFAFILAASVREDRPTLRTADSKLLRVSEFVCERDTAAERFATRVADSDASAETARDTLRTAVRVDRTVELLMLALTALAMIFL